MERLITFAQFSDLFDDKNINIKNGTWHYSEHNTGIAFEDPSKQLVKLRHCIKNKEWVEENASNELNPCTKETADIEPNNLQELSTDVFKSLRRIFDRETLSNIKVNIDECQYYYNGNPTGVGYGKSGHKCDDTKLKCAGGSTYGWIPQQGWLLQEYIGSLE
jgi:hypothetical protein